MQSQQQPVSIIHQCPKQRSPEPWHAGAINAFIHPSMRSSIPQGIHPSINSFTHQCPKQRRLEPWHAWASTHSSIHQYIHPSIMGSKLTSWCLLDRFVHLFKACSTIAIDKNRNESATVHCHICYSNNFERSSSSMMSFGCSSFNLLFLSGKELWEQLYPKPLDRVMMPLATNVVVCQSKNSCGSDCTNSRQKRNKL